MLEPNLGVSMFFFTTTDDERQFGTFQPILQNAEKVQNILVDPKGVFFLNP